MSTVRVTTMDRDAAVAMARAVSNTLEPEETQQSFDDSIATLRAQIISARALLDSTQRELDALALGGPSLKE